MNAAAVEVRKALASYAIGTLMEGGFFAGAYQIDGAPYGLIVAPKALGDLDPQIWIARRKAVPAAQSYVDGRGNTAAMAAAGSKLAQQVLELEIGGLKDWFIGAQDETEIAYRAFKPTTDANTLYGRSGINVSALPPTFPYSKAAPAQTSIEAFRAGGTEAFTADSYWTSTQHADDSGSAWNQHFDYGGQSDWGTDGKLRARAFRRFAL